jgi:hypothetical protein
MWCWSCLVNAYELLALEWQSRWLQIVLIHVARRKKKTVATRCSARASCAAMTDNTGRDHVRTDDHYVYPEIHLPTDFFAPVASQGSKIPVRREINAAPRLAFSVRHLLHRSECSRLVRVAEEATFRNISWEYDPVRCQRSLSLYGSGVEEILCWRRSNGGGDVDGDDGGGGC